MPAEFDEQGCLDSRIGTYGHGQPVCRDSRGVLTSTTDLPLPGRTVTFDGAAVDRVTTGAEGRATVDVTGTIVRAHFAGDHWRDSRPAYYLDAHGYGVSQTAFVGGATGVLGYLNAAISNAVIFVEWLVFGIFALLWMRFMRDQDGYL